MSFLTRHVWLATSLCTAAACALYAVLFFPRGIDHDAQLAHAAERFEAYTLLDEGVTLQVEGDFAGAREKYDAALAIDPRLYRGQLMMGELELAEGHFDAAVARFDVAISGLDNHADAFNSRGVAKWYTGDHRGAIRDFNRALKLNPNFIRAGGNRGLVHLLDGDRDAAQVDFEATIKMREKTAHTWRSVIGMGILHALAGRKEQALDSFSVAAQNKKLGGLYGLENRARLYDAMGNSEAAQRDREAYERHKEAIEEAKRSQAAAPDSTDTGKE